MPVTRSQLQARLSELGIASETVDHPATFTVAESQDVDLGLSGAHTKNLFLKDEDGTLLLVIAKSDTKVDLKVLARRMRLGRLSFGRPELLMDALGVTPGSVTAFAVINDTARRVRVILDAALTSYERVNCHPLENTATTNIALADLLRFIRATGHEPTTLSLAGS